jgi:hypothetical protein
VDIEGETGKTGNLQEIVKLLLFMRKKDISGSKPANCNAGPRDKAGPICAQRGTLLS